jgi:hypothetical protein
MNAALSKLLPYLAPALLGFVLALALFGTTVKERDRVQERTVVRTRIDTVHDVVTVKLRPIAVSGRASLPEFMKNKRQKQVASRPATKSPTGQPGNEDREFMNNKCCAQLDTLISSDSGAVSPDTVHVVYDMVADRFDLRIGFGQRRVPVSLPVVVHDTLIDRERAQSGEQRRPWYEEALMLLGAGAAGYLVGHGR